MARFLLILLVLLPLLAVPASAVQVYRWTDSDGNVQFSDKPPPAGAENVKRTEVYVAPGESGRAPVTAGTNGNAKRAGGNDVLVVGEGSDNPNTGASSPGGSSGGAPGGGGGAAGGGNAGGGAPGGGEGTGGDGGDYASSEGSSPAPTGDGQSAPADGAGGDTGSAPGGPGAAAAATRSPSGPGGTGAGTASTGSGARRTADPNADNPIPPGAIPGAPVVAPRDTQDGSASAPRGSESVTATTRALPPAPEPIAAPVAEPPAAPRPAPRRRADIPPCLPGPVPLQRPLVDKFAEWELSPHWHFGNRMDSEVGINADAINTGFTFDGPPYHEIVSSESATQFNFFEGDTALPLAAQIRFRFPLLKPENAATATIVWEAKYDIRFFTGNKAFQLSYDNGRQIEHNPVSGMEDPDNPTWLMVPGTRVYRTQILGGNGIEWMISSGDWPKRNIQPALDAPGRAYPYCYARDHVTGTHPRAFLVKPGQWYRYIYTLDWRTEPHRVWLWMEAEDSPRTLLVADEVDPSKGFVLQFSEEGPGLDYFWFEFNNSKTRNEVDFHVRVRNFFVLRNVLGGDL